MMYIHTNYATYLPSSYIDVCLYLVGGEIKIYYYLLLLLFIRSSSPRIGQQSEKINYVRGQELGSLLKLIIEHNLLRNMYGV
jgi:hypothetical protein